MAYSYASISHSDPDLFTVKLNAEQFALLRDALHAARCVSQGNVTMAEVYLSHAEGSVYEDLCTFLCESKGYHRVNS